MVQDPTQALDGMQRQLGWLQQVMDPNFWEQIRALTAAASPPPPGTPAMGAPAMAAAAPAGARTARLTPPAPAAQPSVDLYLTIHEVVLQAVLPGLASPAAVTLTLGSPTELTLEVWLPPPPPLTSPLQRERPTGYAVRSITLPAPVQAEGGSARLQNGLLEVRLLRSEPGTGGSAVAALPVSVPVR